MTDHDELLSPFLRAADPSDARIRLVEIAAKQAEKLPWGVNYPGMERRHREHGPAGRCDDDGCSAWADVAEGEHAAYALAARTAVIRDTLCIAEALAGWVSRGAMPEDQMDDWLAEQDTPED